MMAGMLLTLGGALMVPDSLGEPTMGVVVFGDSFTAALDVDAARDDPSLSWATGTQLPAPSVVQRLEASGWHVRSANVAQSGDRARDLIDQLGRAPAHADLVLIWIGTNDLCDPRTGTSAFAADVDRSFQAIGERYPDASVLVFAPPSMPSVERLQRSVPQAARSWAESGACSVFFGEDRSESKSVQRHQEFAQVLEESATRHGFATSRSLEDLDRPLSEWAGTDYLHPSPQGLAWFADRAWADVWSLLAAPEAE